MLSQMRILRLTKGIKLKEMAKKTGISSSFLSKIERGAMKGSIKTRTKIAVFLGYKERA